MFLALPAGDHPDLLLLNTGYHQFVISQTDIHFTVKGGPLYPFHKQVVEVLSVANEWQRRACHSLLTLHINYNYRPPPPFLAFVSLQLIREKEDEKMQMRHLQENGNRGLWQEQNADVSKAHKIGVHHDNSKNCAEAMTT